MTRPAEPRRIVLPRPPEPPPRHPFPLLASIAPVVGSVIIWAVTSSPFALVFAALGPVIAVATMADSWLQGRRSLRRDRARFADELATVRALINEAHQREYQERRMITPGALAILDAPLHDPERWRGSFAVALPVSVGIGVRASELRVDGTEGAGTTKSDSSAIAELAEIAGSVRAPVVIDARLGIGIVGPPVAAHAVARGIVLQLAALLPPETAHCSCGSEDADWLSLLPHAVETTPDGRVVRWSDADGSAVIATATVAGRLPRECRVVILAGGKDGSRVASHPDPELCVELEPERVSVAQATAAAERLGRAAGDRGSSTRRLPDSVDWSSLPHPANRGGLAAGFLVDEHGVVAIDLVSQGPHAVVAGTTGSGKSELLVSWLLAIAAAHGPDEVTFLLVDFKGGASFGPVSRLPHVVGLVTDLDERTAHRALESLRAEVVFREHALAAAGVRSIDELGAGSSLPRLLIVVDEFAALVSGFDELHALFADLAARGRSLGVHLVLSTQRPAGVVRDSVLANVPLRISLRVNNRADSVALIGTDAASSLPARPAGRAVVALGSDEQFVTQVALADSRDADAVVAHWRDSPAPRRPWRDDLPESLSLAELVPVAGRPFGLLDLPQQQRQATAAWNPLTDGNLLVLGSARAGKTFALSALAHDGDATVVPAGIEGAWDAVSAAVDRVRSASGGQQLLLIDDLDALLPRFGDDHEPAFIDLLVELLRTGGATGVHVALSARRITAQLHPVVALCDSRLVLRQQNRQEHLLAGGDPDLFAASAPPGRGEWRGASVQIAVAPPAVSSGPNEDPVFDPMNWATTLVVSTRPSEFARRWDAAELRSTEATLGVRDASSPRVIVADADGWHADWMRLTSLRAASAMLFDGCTVADFRALSGTRRLPPPIERPGAKGWLLEPEGRLGRVVL